MSDQQPRPRLSIVIPSCNGERHLPACLDSLRGQGFRDFEVTVVENGSEDRTAAIVAEQYPEVKLISLGGRRGFSIPVNTGWRASRSDLIFLLNDDTVCAPDCLEKLVQAAAEHPQYSFFAARMMYFDDPAVINSAGHRLLRNGTVVEAGGGAAYEECFRTPREVFGACAGAAVYRRELLERLGGMDEDFWIINEDVDLDFRAQLHGYRCLFVPGAEVLHRVSQFMGSGSPRMVHAYVKNLGLYLIKDLPPVFWRDLRREVLLHNWKASSALVREGRLGVLWRARWDLLRLGGRMLAKRRRMTRELFERGQAVREWAERDAVPQGPCDVAAEAASSSPGGKLWRNAWPGFVSLLLMWPLLMWLGCAALQDRMLRPRS